jgi:SAM-dependent methyltransferase
MRHRLCASSDFIRKSAHGCDGSEIYLSALDYAAQRVSHADLIQADICRFPFESEFDVIGSFDVLEYIDNDMLALQNIHKALKGNGGLILI